MNRRQRLMVEYSSECEKKTLQGEGSLPNRRLHRQNKTRYCLDDQYHLAVLPPCRLDAPAREAPDARTSLLLDEALRFLYSSLHSQVPRRHQRALASVFTVARRDTRSTTVGHLRPC